MNSHETIIIYETITVGGPDEILDVDHEIIENMKRRLAESGNN